MTLSWHQQRAAGMHALPYDVVGYTFDGTILCAACAGKHGLDGNTTAIFRDQVDGTEICDSCRDRIES